MRSTDGLALSALELGAAGAPTVVLIHGYPDTGAMWKPVAARLARHLHVIAYDVRGAGESEAPGALAGYDLAQLTDDFVAVIAALAPGEAVHVVGHDWGGIQGWELATRPELAGRLRSFTAIAGPSLDQVALLVRSRAGRRPWQAWRSFYIAPLLVPGAPTLLWRALGRDRWRRLQRMEGVPPAGDYPARTLVEDAIRGAGLYRRNIPRRLVRPRRDAFAHAPVQLIVPTRDRYIPEYYYALAERFAPGLRRTRMDGPHWLPRTHPEPVAEAILSFVREHEV